jgi:hypothetical protein
MGSEVEDQLGLLDLDTGADRVVATETPCCGSI